MDRTMSERALTDLFPNTVEDEHSITLFKSDLQLSAPNVTADQFVAAIAIKARWVLTQTQFNDNFDQNIFFADGYDSFTTKNDGYDDIRFVVRQIVINLAKPDNSQMNPDDY